ncbi:MAG: hypothetical protein A2252_08095 [Elusimicrobia bacterium RIFOXYA2_FULL_39_19]|nr:MAG: hypothetical protein A2252_08095 [Elusimicrobia bacterium RIFOXYA2_FULL_39_19]
MDLILYLLAVPFVAGLVCAVIPKKQRLIAELLALAGSIAVFLMTFIIFRTNPVNFQLFGLELFRIDNFNRFLVLFIALFGILVILYSTKFFPKTDKFSISSFYYTSVLWSISAALGCVLANNLILMLVFWGFLGLTLYVLIQSNSPDSKDAAKKTFIIVGGSDCLMILGIAIIWVLTGTLQMDKIFLSTADSTLALTAFLCLAIGAFAKAGAMPFHTWIPDMAPVTPAPVIALLPASLDKLLGIYLLARISLNLFSLSLPLTAFLMFIGAVTIIAAVFMAMIQHDLKKLLSYHAVSQVGYMILGLATGNPVGIAGGIFHMLNNAIYKSCFFLCGGSIEKKTGTTDLDKLGALAGKAGMPLTFAAFFIASMSISGVPPFNGFVSKWMIYQGLITQFQNASPKFQIIALVCLVAAMFGSALTLASFMKLIHAIFFAQKKNEQKGEVNWQMWLPQLLLAGLCIVFGVFAFALPLKYFIIPSLSAFNLQLSGNLIGFWQPELATMLLIACIIIGIIIFLASFSLGSVIKRHKIFIGGEVLPENQRVTGVDFYQTIKEIKIFDQTYALAQKKVFDIYDWGKAIVNAFASALALMHTGNMHIYLAMSIMGLTILLYVFLGK